MTWKVLVTAPYFLRVIDEFRPRLEAADIEVATVPVHERLNEAELISVIETFDGVICGDDAFTEKVLQAAPRLRIISKWGTGVDSIDTTAAAKRGIQVSNTPNAFTDAVADTTLGYILNFARAISRMNDEVRLGAWSKPNLASLNECTLGVVGVGNIGRAVVRRARAFGMMTFGTDPVPIDAGFLNETSTKMLPLFELLTQADFVSLHCDLNPTSFHLVGRLELNAMKSSAYLINTARGRIIDESALIDALQDKGIAGAALDVFEVEPLPASSLLRKLPNCLLGTHNANSSFEAYRRVHESTIENLVKVLHRKS